MNHHLVFIAVVIASLMPGASLGQPSENGAPSVTTKEVSNHVAAYYEALAIGDWALISRFCAITADASPRKYYYDPRAGALNGEMAWAISAIIPVRYVDPRTGKSPERSLLVVGAYCDPPEKHPATATSGDKQDAVSRHSTGMITVDLWFGDKSVWRVIPQGEFHSNAIQFTDVPYSNAGLGTQFASLAEIQAKAQEDRDNLASLKSQAESQIQRFLRNAEPVLRDKSLTPEQKQEALRKMMPK